MSINIYRDHGNYYGLGITWWPKWPELDIRFICFSIEVTFRDELKEGFRVRYHE